MKDTLIIEHLRRGDEEAFKYIYEHHYVLLCRFANQILNDAALSEEVVDDAIFYLWEHRREIEITYSVRAYLMRAVRNRCLNELQSLRHREELHFSSFMLPENMDFLDSVFVEENQPLGVLLERELEDELTRSIEELDAVIENSHMVGTEAADVHSFQSTYSSVILDLDTREVTDGIGHGETVQRL